MGIDALIESVVELIQQILKFSVSCLDPEVVVTLLTGETFSVEFCSGMMPASIS